MSIKKIILTPVLALFLISLMGFQSKENTWKTLSDVTYDVRYDEEYGYDVEVPVFGPKVLAIDGSNIVLTGYMIPLEGIKKQNYFIISAFPYASCFFCGAAGPETVMEVYTKEAIPYTTKPITIKGRLGLNDSDINQLIYIMKDAKLHY